MNYKNTGLIAGLICAIALWIIGFILIEQNVFHFDRDFEPLAFYFIILPISIFIGGFVTGIFSRKSDRRVRDIFLLNPSLYNALAVIIFLHIVQRISIRFPEDIIGLAGMLLIQLPSILLSYFGMMIALIKIKK